LTEEFGKIVNSVVAGQNAVITFIFKSYFSDYLHSCCQFVFDTKLFSSTAEINGNNIGLQGGGSSYR
jgi:hypothetical protein